VGALALSLGSAAPAAEPSWKILVFTKTAGFRHDSIPAAIQAVQQLGAANGFGVDQTEDAGAFSDANLGQYRAVMFLLTTGDVLNDAQQAAFQRYIEGGGGFVGVHSAADTEHDWPWYGKLVGTYFLSHPAIQTAQIDVADPRDPSTAGLPAVWTRTDEWYNFTSDPRPSVNVLMTLDERTYDPGPDAMGADHPISWWHAYDGGRAWYTGLGHTDETYSDPLFLAFLLGGIRYAAAPPTASQFAVASLGATVSARRVSVSVTVTGCGACSGSARLGRVSAKLRFAGGAGTGLLTHVPRGAGRVYVVVRDAATGRSISVSRPVRVR
jgi:type 1 glutamine amidotransferase